jgi:hypothetical protein
MEGREGRWKDEASEAEEGPERVKEEKAGGGGEGGEWRWRRRRRRRRHRWKGASRGRGGGERGMARGRDFKRNQFRVAVQSNVTPAAAGVNVGRNSNFTAPARSLAIAEAALRNVTAGIALLPRPTKFMRIS